MKKLFHLLSMLLVATAMGTVGCSGSSSDCAGVANTCETEGSVRCSSDNLAVEACAPNADGCLVWTAESCGSGMLCDDSGDAPGCVVGCEHECDPAAFPACSSDNSAIEICVLQADGCYDLVSSSCDAGLACDDSGDEPVCACTNDCDPTQYPACSDDASAIETCVQGDDGCYDLVSTACADNSACDDTGDAPECVLQCENDCVPDDFPACSESGFAVETCQMGQDGCYDIISTDCGPAQFCDPSTVTCETSACSDDCDPNNFPACSADSLAVETCDRQADGCFDLIVTACAHAESCDPTTATCQSSGCDDGCDPANYPACSADSSAVDTCEIQADGCYDVVSTACDENYACDADSVTCELTCTNDCDPANYPACSADSSAVETCEVQADGCYDVVGTACDENYACDADSVTCEPTCTNDCDPANYPACSADSLAVETCEVQADGCYDLLDASCGFSQICDDSVDPPVCVDDTSCEDRVADGSFEGGTPNDDWDEASTNFGSPICTEATCGNAAGTMLPRTGTFYVWMGGIDQVEDASVSQTIHIANGALAQLRFYLHIPATIDSDQEVFEVMMDSDVLFSINGTETGPYADDYTLVELDVGNYTDGMAHVLTFHASTTGAVGQVVTNIALDDVSITSCGGTCFNECDTPDELVCSDDFTQLNVCQLNAATGCNDWVLDTDCASNAQTCDNSTDPVSCVACQDECASDGLTRCKGIWVETCAAGPDTCLDWVQSVDCTDVGYCDSSLDPAVCAPYNSMTPGDNCDDPGLVVLDIPASLPAQAIGQTTCGRGDDYSDTCMGSYDGGEDIVYQLNATEDLAINIIIDPKETSWTGIGVGPGCPLGADDCLIAGGSTGSDPYMTGCFSMPAGMYTLMVDIYPTPTCIPDFDLLIERCECATDQTQCVDGMTASVCNAVGQWENTQCEDGCTQLPSGDFGCFYRPKVEGDLVITEIMQNPSAVSDDLGEWFEVINNSGQLVNLNGLTFKDDGSDAFTVDSDVFVATGAFAVLGNNPDLVSNGGVAQDFSYAASAMSLGNGSDEIEILNGDVQIDRVAWDNGSTFPDPSGASMSLDPQSFDTSSNDDGSNWCIGQTPYGDGDSGTPGANNLPCDLIYLENLDADPGLTMTGEWAWGVPDAAAYPAGPAGCANGSTGCLGTNLAGDYSNDLSFDSNYVQVGPIDLSGASSAILYFSMWLNAENNWDGAIVQVSTDGTTFELLPVQTPAYNWHDPADAWTGDFGTDWLSVAADLTTWVGGDVYLRFALSSDGSATRPGMYVDDIMVGAN